MTKPYSLRELRSRVRALIRRAYGELAMTDSTLIYAADFVIDRASGQVMRNDQLLNLTPTEFRMLILFAQHPGQVLSRRQILDAVWGHTSEIESESTVNVHIRRLREKIEPDPGSPALILTVPGIGYRFNP
jgi:DNA-binding response OmpR family regulator